MKETSALLARSHAPKRVGRKSDGKRTRAVNNRLAPGMHGARRTANARWRAFDDLPDCVADAIRDSRSILCPVAALRLVDQGKAKPEKIARFLRERAAWTEWRVLAADFGETIATRLRPDAPTRKPSLRRWS